MRASIPRPARDAIVSLPAPYQEALETLVRSRGVARAADELHVSETALDALRYGGSAKPATVEKVRAALEAYEQRKKEGKP